MTAEHPRYSTSEDLLEHSLEAAVGSLECETRLLRIRDLSFRACEGFYSKSARACTWPCSITQMDPSDEMETGVRGRGALGGRDHGGHAYSLGRREQSLLQDGGKDELHPEPGDAGQQAPAAKQGRGVHHYGRAGQRAGRGRADARVLRGDRLPVSAVSLHCALAGLERGGHGEQPESTFSALNRCTRGRPRWCGAAPRWPKS